jgi:hypothetical protein
MKSRAKGAHKRQRSAKNRKTTQLCVEQLEARLMRAADTIELGLQALLSNESESDSVLASSAFINQDVESNALFSSGFGSGGFGNGNQAPTIASPLMLVGGNTVYGNTVNASILGADDQPERDLTYHWRIMESPANAVVTFAKNGSNDAKTNTLTFSAPGEYLLRAGIVDRGNLRVATELRFRVEFSNSSSNQAPTIAVPLNLVGGNVVSGSTVNASILGADDRPESELTYHWRILESPNNAAVSFARNGTNAAKNNTLTFKAPGDYLLRAGILDRGNLRVATELRFRVEFPAPPTNQAPTIAIPLNLAGGNVVSGSTVNASILGADDRPESELTYHWRILESPNNAEVIFANNGTNAAKNNTLTFKAPGDYLLRAGILDRGNLRVATELRFRVEFPAPPVNQAPTIAVPLAFLGGDVVRSQSVNATILGADDQGENNLVYHWRILESPDNVGVSFARNGSNAAKSNTLSFSRPGEYLLRVGIVDSGNLRVATEMRFTVEQTLTTLRVVTPENTLIQPDGAYTTSTSTASFRLSARDQFGNLLPAPTNVSWQLLKGPDQGLMRVEPQGDTTDLSFSVEGRYVVRMTSGTHTYKFAVYVGATAAPTKWQVLDSNGTPVPDTTPVAVSGKNAKITVRLLDQFDKLMAKSASINWSTRLAPEGGTAQVTFNGEDATLTFDTTGDYQLLFSGGGKTKNVNVSVKPVLTTLEVTPGTATLAGGAVQQFQVRGIDQFGKYMTSTPTVTWSATGGTVTNKGVFTASVNASSATVTAKNGSLASSATITVVEQPVLTTLELTPDTATVNTGATQQFTVKGKDQFGNVMAGTPSVTWSATGGTVSSSGLFTAGSTGGNASVKVTSGSISKTVTITVVEQPVLTTLELTPDTATVNTGATQQFTVKGKDQFGNVMAGTPSVTWSATGGTVSSSGLFTAGSTGGNASVKVTSGSISKTVTITVVEQPVLTTLELTPDTATVNTGATQQFTVKGKDQFGNVMAGTPSVTWSATGGTVSSSGLFTAGSTGGNASVKVTSGSISKTVTITVVEQPVLTTLELTPDTATVNTGATQQFTVKGKDQFGNDMAGTPSVTWSATGGTVSTTGLFTAGSTVGNASVTVTSGSISKTVTINVVESAVLTTLEADPRYGHGEHGCDPAVHGQG